MMTMERPPAPDAGRNPDRGFPRIEGLRKSIGDSDYVYAAVHRIAIVLSDRLVEHGRTYGNEGRRKGRRT